MGTKNHPRKKHPPSYRTSYYVEDEDATLKDVEAGLAQTLLIIRSYLDAKHLRYEETAYLISRENVKKYQALLKDPSIGNKLDLILRKNPNWSAAEALAECIK